MLSYTAPISNTQLSLIGASIYSAGELTVIRSPLLLTPPDS